MRYTTAAYGVTAIKGAKAGTVHDPSHHNPLHRLWDAAGKLKDAIEDLAFSRIGFLRAQRLHKIRRYLNLQRPQPSAGIPDGVLDMENVIGANANVVGYFIAVERRDDPDKDLHKSIVLAIRGTYSVSGLLADAEGFSAPFCGGYAHKGMHFPRSSS